MVIWLTGLSSSGKTTLGRLIFDLWKPEAPNTVMVDGNEVRDVLGYGSGTDTFSAAGRKAVAERYCHICRWLDGQDVNVVCCTISSFEDLRERNRRTLSRYFEVFIDVPMETLFRRDTKNLYAPARRGEISDVVGIDIPFTPPASPDLVIDNAPDRSDLRPLATQILGAALNPLTD